MWLCLSDPFLSIVVHKDRVDIERVFPEARVKEMPGRDYLFQLEMPHDVVSEVIVHYIRTIWPRPLVCVASM